MLSDMNSAILELDLARRLQDDMLLLLLVGLLLLEVDG